MKENVLEVKIVKMNDKYSCLTITKQDDTVIERGEFKFTASNGIKIYSEICPANYEQYNRLCIQGTDRLLDNEIMKVKNSSIPKIEEAIKELNDKYGKVKRWRAKKGEVYYWIGKMGQVIREKEDLTRPDFLAYQSGNYFRTEKQAELAVKKQKELFETLHKEFGE